SSACHVTAPLSPPTLREERVMTATPSAADLADAHPPAGIVWAYYFGPDGDAAPIPNEDVGAALASFTAGWVWVHLALADTRCRAWIAQHAPVSDAAREL